jgi:hypothetical protein
LFLVFLIIMEIALMMEAAGTSETSASFYWTPRRYNPEDNHLNTRGRENLTSYELRVTCTIVSFLHLEYTIHFRTVLVTWCLVLPCNTTHQPLFCWLGVQTFWCIIYAVTLQ